MTRGTFLKVMAYLGYFIPRNRVQMAYLVGILSCLTFGRGKSLDQSIADRPEKVKVDLDCFPIIFGRTKSIVLMALHVGMVRKRSGIAVWFLSVIGIFVVVKNSV